MLSSFEKPSYQQFDKVLLCMTITFDGNRNDITQHSSSKPRLGYKWTTIVHLTIEYAVSWRTAPTASGKVFLLVINISLVQYSAQYHIILFWYSLLENYHPKKSLNSWISLHFGIRIRWKLFLISSRSLHHFIVIWFQSYDLLERSIHGLKSPNRFYLSWLIRLRNG